MITSDCKAIGKKPWGSLPSAFGDGKERNDEEEEESSDDEEEGIEESEEEEGIDESEEEEGIDESEEEEGQMMAPPPPSAGAAATGGGAVRAPWPDGDDSVVPSSAADLRKPGDETPMAAGGPPKQLFTVLREAAADGDAQLTAVF
jgi:hypothetical protein